MQVLQTGHDVEPTNAAINATIASSLSKVGRFQEAIVFSQRAVDADPFSAEKAAQRARLIGLSGNVQTATIALQAARRRFASDRAVTQTEFRIAALVGDPDHATAMLADPERGFNLPPEAVALWRSLIAARAAPSPALRDAAYRLFDAGMEAHPKVDLDTLEKLALLQRVDEAYSDADRLSLHGTGTEATETLFTTAFAPLRADPRFMTLAARLGLVAIWMGTDRWPDFCGDASLGYDCRVEAKRALSPDVRPLVAGR